MEDHGVIDLRDSRMMHKFYGENWSDMGIKKATRWAIKASEVLLKWRGTVPIEFCDVVDECSGEGLGTLAEMLDLVEAKGKGMCKSRSLKDLALSQGSEAKPKSTSSDRALGCCPMLPSVRAVCCSKVASYPRWLRPPECVLKWTL